MLADRDLRARFDGAAALEHVLAAVRDVVDGEISASGAVARVKAAILARRRADRRTAGRRWMAVAAGLVVAAGIGSFIDFTVLGPADHGSEVVVVDPLVFGAVTADAQ